MDGHPPELFATAADDSALFGDKAQEVPREVSAEGDLESGALWRRICQRAPMNEEISLKQIQKIEIETDSDPHLNKCTRDRDHVGNDVFVKLVDERYIQDTSE
jgi:hypothetical protein